MSGRLEEMPGEEGYPAYLAGAHRAQFYERAGRVVCLGTDEREGALSRRRRGLASGRRPLRPGRPGHAARRQGLLGLEDRLAFERHFPAINWLNELLALPREPATATSGPRSSEDWDGDAQRGHAHPPAGGRAARRSSAGRRRRALGRRPADRSETAQGRSARTSSTRTPSTKSTPTPRSRSSSGCSSCIMSFDEARPGGGRAGRGVGGRTRACPSGRRSPGPSYIPEDDMDELDAIAGRSRRR